MPNTENLFNLKIHRLSQAQYDREKAANNLDSTALYLTPDNGYVTAGQNPDSPIGTCATAEGFTTNAGAEYSHAEGYCTTTVGTLYNGGVGLGTYAHAEGLYSHAMAEAAHAEGVNTSAEGRASHAEGDSTIAKGECAHAEGYGTIANSYQHVEGYFNIEDTANKYLHIIGNGNPYGERSNAFTIDTQGNGWFAGTVSSKFIKPINTKEELAAAAQGRFVLESEIHPQIKASTGKDADGVYYVQTGVSDDNTNVSINLNGFAIGRTLSVTGAAPCRLRPGGSSLARRVKLLNGTVSNFYIDNLTLENCVYRLEPDKTFYTYSNGTAALFNNCAFKNCTIILETGGGWSWGVNTIFNNCSVENSKVVYVGSLSGQYVSERNIFNNSNTSSTSSMKNVDFEFFTTDTDVSYIHFGSFVENTMAPTTHYGKLTTIHTQSTTSGTTSTTGVANTVYYVKTC